MHTPQRISEYVQVKSVRDVCWVRVQERPALLQVVLHLAVLVSGCSLVPSCFSGHSHQHFGGLLEGEFLTGTQLFLLLLDLTAE